MNLVLTIAWWAMAIGFVLILVGLFLAPLWMERGSRRH